MRRLISLLSQRRLSDPLDGQATHGASRQLTVYMYRSTAVCWTCTRCSTSHTPQCTWCAHAQGQPSAVPGPSTLIDYPLPPYTHTPSRQVRLVTLQQGLYDPAEHTVHVVTVAEGREYEGRTIVDSDAQRIWHHMEDWVASPLD